jgi:hypothetical protein
MNLTNELFERFQVLPESHRAGVAMHLFFCASRTGSCFQMELHRQLQFAVEIEERLARTNSRFQAVPVAPVTPGPSEPDP